MINGSVQMKKTRIRKFRMYFEDWEQPAAKKEDPENKQRILTKYGGLQFKDIDNGDVLTIDRDELHYSTPAKGSDWKFKQYHLMVYQETKREDKESWVPWDIPQVMACLEESIEELNKDVVLVEKGEEETDATANKKTAASRKKNK